MVFNGNGVSQKKTIVDCGRAAVKSSGDREVSNSSDEWDFFSRLHMNAGRTNKKKGRDELKNETKGRNGKGETRNRMATKKGGGRLEINNCRGQ
jgi:hypothetical protein